MNRYMIFFGLILILSSTVFSADPKILDVVHNQPYINKPTTFTINVEADTSQGVIRFVDNGYLITQQSFSPTNQTITFNYTWNVKESRNVRFYITDFNQPDTNLLNNEWQENINILKGLDLTITSFAPTPQVIPPEQDINFLVTIKNDGDEAYSGSIPIEVILDGNVICSTSIDGIDFNDKTANCNWVSPQTQREDYTFVAHVNRNGVIPELTLTNNSFSFNTSTAPKPDLFVKSIIAPTNIRRSSVTNIGIIIANQGGAKAENFMTNIYLAFDDGQKYRAYYKETTILNGGSEIGIDFVNIFESVGEYTISVWVDENNSVVESNENNNLYSYKIKVYDFNVDDVFRENEELRKEIIVEAGRTDACLIEKNTFMQDLLRKEDELENTQSDLRMCNQNNYSEISNWKDSFDGNKDAMLNIMEAKYNDLVNEKNSIVRQKDEEISNVTNEKNQWAMLIVLLFMALAGYLGYDEYRKGKGKKSVNQWGSQE